MQKTRIGDSMDKTVTEWIYIKNQDDSQKLLLVKFDFWIIRFSRPEIDRRIHRGV
jgi:hypothetical protein